MSDKEKRLEREKDPPKPLFLPTIKGIRYTKRDVEILRELNPEIKVFPDGSYTIDGETPEQINAKYKRSIEGLKEWARSGPVKEPARLVPKKATK